MEVKLHRDHQNPEKSTDDPSRGVFLEKAPRNDREKGRMPALHNPVVGRRSRGRYRQGSSEPSSPTKAQPEPLGMEPIEPEIKRTLVVPKQAAPDQAAKWGSHSKNKDNEVFHQLMEKACRGICQEGPSESTPREQANNSREYRDYNSDYNREYNRKYSDPQGHTSRRERDRQSRSKTWQQKQRPRWQAGSVILGAQTTQEPQPRERRPGSNQGRRVTPPLPLTT